MVVEVVAVVVVVVVMVPWFHGSGGCGVGSKGRIDGGAYGDDDTRWQSPFLTSTSDSWSIQ